MRLRRDLAGGPRPAFPEDDEKQRTRPSLFLCTQLVVGIRHKRRVLAALWTGVLKPVHLRCCAQPGPAQHTPALLPRRADATRTLLPESRVELEAYSLAVSAGQLGQYPHIPSLFICLHPTTMKLPGIAARVSRGDDVCLDTHLLFPCG
jgi:hypothetical protein